LGPCHDRADNCLPKLQDRDQADRVAAAPLWAKREEQIRGVIESTAGMYGDLQGIAGKTLQEIDGLDMPLLPQDADTDSTK
jgi:hypothetical protein